MSEADSVVVPFDELPVLPGSGLRHSWDVHGAGDQLGTLNRLTPAVVAAAAASVRTGERVGMSLPLGLPDPPFFGRRAYKHSFVPMGPAAVPAVRTRPGAAWHPPLGGARHRRAPPS